MFAQRLKNAAQHVSAQGFETVYVSLHGSQNYGLAIHEADYQSDYDFKCIVLSSLRDLVEGKKPASLTLETADGQIDVKDIRVFCDSLERMNPAYLESLATAHRLILPGGEGMERIREMLPLLMEERAAVFAKACEGLFEDKAKRMCHDSPAVHDRITRYGYDGKQPHHMLRLLCQLRIFNQTGEFSLEAPQTAHELLMRLKKNEISLDEVRGMIPAWRKEMRELRSKIEQKYGAPKSEAHEALLRVTHEMMMAHCQRG